MNELIRIFKTFFGYLRRPDLYPELLRKIISNLFNRKSAFRDKETAVSWAKENAVSQAEAISVLFKVDAIPFREQFKNIYTEAIQIEKNCPVKMGGAGALDVIYYAAEFTQARNILETGVAYGWSSLSALTSLKKRDGKLFSSDMPYLGQNGDAYVGCVVPDELNRHWNLSRQADRESLPKIFKENAVFDVVHYDSDKSYDGRMWAYRELFAHLRSGGVFISDDISDNAAFKDFCEANDIQPKIVSFEGKYVGVFIKD